MQNYNVKFKILEFLLLLTAFFLLLTVPVFAHTDGGIWKPGQPIVPCGRFSQCINNTCANGLGPCTTSAQCREPDSPPCDQCQILIF